jgi:hypothetical protein
MVEVDPRVGEDGHPRGAQRREGGHAVADRVPISSLFGAELISSVGNNITELAVPWFVLVTTGSAVRTGLAGAAMGIGSVLAPVLGGPQVDRLGGLVEPLLDLRRACPGWSC